MSQAKKCRVTENMAVDLRYQSMSSTGIRASTFFRSVMGRSNLSGTNRDQVLPIHRERGPLRCFSMSKTWRLRFWLRPVFDLRKFDQVFMLPELLRT